MPLPAIEPVYADALPEFAQFLHEHLASDRSRAEWEQGLGTTWDSERPNFGFVLRDAGRIVGGIGAFYALRSIRGKNERLCNITSWCVLDAYRQQSMRLAMALLSQQGMHFTDFSPTKVVAGTLQFLKFRPLDERQAVIPNLPNLGASRVVDDPEKIRQLLQGDALKVYCDHVGYRWLNHVLIGDGSGWCHVIYKRRTFKHLPSAQILYLSDKLMFRRCLGWLSGHLLLRGMASTHIECRSLDGLPWLSRIRSGFNPKLYRSTSLVDDDIDYLYSETMVLDL